MKKNYGQLAKWTDPEETSDSLLQLSLLQNSMAFNGLVPTGCSKFTADVTNILSDTRLTSVPVEIDSKDFLKQSDKYHQVKTYPESEDERHKDM